MTKDERKAAMQAWRDNLSRGDCAALRRCTTPADAIPLRSVHALARTLGVGFNPAARAAIILAGVRSHKPGAHPAAQLQAASFSEDRFQRLLRSTSDEEIISGFRRALTMAKGAINLPEFALGALSWRFDSTRREWATAYFNQCSK